MTTATEKKDTRPVMPVLSNATQEDDSQFDPV
jgi:hypothetical protein